MSIHEQEVAPDNTGLPHEHNYEPQYNTDTKRGWSRLPKPIQGLLIGGVAVGMGGSLYVLGPQEGESTPAEQPSTDQSELENEIETNDAIEAPDENQPTPNDNNAAESPEEENETGTDNFDSIYWKTMWETESSVIQGPEGDAATHSAMENVTADLLGRIASTRQATTEQEAYLSSRIQNIHGATYFIENEDGILKIEDPIVYGLLYEGGGTLSYVWQANREERENFTILYMDNGEWQSFVISEYNDVRWFSDRTAELAGVAYRNDGPIIREGTMSQASLQEGSERILIDTEQFGAITIPKDPARFATIEDAIDATMADPDYRLSGLLEIADDIQKS